MRTFLFSLLVVPLLPGVTIGQDERTGDAEKLFKKMERTLCEAKTLQFEYKMVLEYGGRKSERVTGSFLLGEENRARMKILCEG